MDLTRAVKAAKMLKQITRHLASRTRSFSTSNPRNHKVTVCGAAGGIGQPLSLFLKLNPLVTELALYDTVPVMPGVAVDLSHIDREGEVVGLCGPDNLPMAVNCAKIVVIPAGVARKPGMKREDLFKVNAEVVRTITEIVAQVSPQAIIAIITNPVNALVPLCAEVLKKHGVYDPRRVFGVSSLDVIRARTFTGQLIKRDPQKIKIPVIGGHSGNTIVPVLSNVEPPNLEIDSTEIEKLTKRIQEGGTEVVEAKGGAGSATLSTAYAAADFVNSLLRGLDGQKGVIEYSYVESKVTEATFFSTALELGKEGIKENRGLPKLNAYETDLVVKALPELKKDIQTGIDFVKNHSKK